MPPRERRPSSFGSGSLLGPVAPIPDDDDPTPEPTAQAAAEATSDLSAMPEGNGTIVPESQRPRDKRGGRPMARRRRGKDDEPPTTVRLNDRAGAALWEAFVEAKRDDPFLTYVEYASAVVTDGLDRGRRRRNR